MGAIQRRAPSWGALREGMCPRHKGSQPGGSWEIDQVHELRAQATIKLVQVFFFLCKSMEMQDNGFPCTLNLLSANSIKVLLAT